MNGRATPNDDALRTDPGLHGQLARRASGRLPEDLATSVFEALDREPAKPPPAWLSSAGSPRFHLPAPLLAAGGMAAALILVAALVVAPGLGRGPAASGIAGYPADRALTSIELAVLMAGPALPVNTTLVASVTIDARTDVCPMNRYPTIGIVEAMGSQVCVMGSTLAETMTEPAVTGTFAFRYIAPGYLGLLGEITAASGSRLAFHVADEWPLGGKTFLVEGWLGSAGLVYSCPSSEGPGDVLLPGGDDCPNDNWLSDSSNAPQMGAAPPAIGTLAIAPNGNARYVEAGAARQIDSIDDTAPIHGVFVVRAVTGPCADQPSTSSVGCPVWRVLAKIAGVALPGPTASVAPTPSWTPGPPETPVTGSYPADRPLTAAELAAAMAAGIAKDQVVVAQASIGADPSCAAFGKYRPIGLLAGTGLCVVGIADDDPNHSPSAASGLFAFRVLNDTTLGFMANIDSYEGPSDSWPAGKTILVTGWLGEQTGFFSGPLIGAPSNEPLDPGGMPRQVFWISSGQGTGAWQSARPSDFGQIWLPDYPEQFGGLLPTALGVRSTYLVRDETRCNKVTATNVGFSQFCGWQIMARVDPLTIPAERTPTPVAEPSASPTTSLAPVGLSGPGGRPLTVPEFQTAWTSDPAHLAGRVVITKGPVATGFACVWPPTAASSCQSVYLPGYIAQEGYWAVRVGGNGELSIVGELATTANGGFVFAVGDDNVSSPTDAYRLVDGWLEYGPGDGCDVNPQPSTFGITCLDSHLTGMPGATAFWEILQNDAYRTFGSTDINAGPIHGLWLVHVCTACRFDEILARLSPVG